MESLESVARRGHLRGAAWTRVSHGLHVPADAQGESVRLAAWQLVLPPSGVFTHLTGAGLRGWWLPPLPAWLPVCAAIATDEVRPKRAGIRTTRHRNTPQSETIGGLRVGLAVEVLLACAADLELLDLVVLVDAALASGQCTISEVAAACGTGRRGTPRLRAALALADARAESAWEVLLRMLHTSCDVQVEPQLEVWEGGVLLGRGDLWITGTRTLQEYDGGDHLERRRHRDDLRRDRRLRAHDWQRNGYTAPDLLHRAVGVLRDADRAIGREHRPERIRAWNALLADSLFTPAGTERLRARWRIPAPAGVRDVAENCTDRTL